eukprot:SAG31_NODE_1178_length_9531_cov_3.040818_6_plen_137_part_00
MRLHERRRRRKATGTHQRRPRRVVVRGDLHRSRCGLPRKLSLLCGQLLLSAFVSERNCFCSIVTFTSRFFLCHFMFHAGSLLLRQGNASSLLHLCKFMEHCTLVAGVVGGTIDSPIRWLQNCAARAFVIGGAKRVP